MAFTGTWSMISLISLIKLCIAIEVNYINYGAGTYGGYTKSGDYPKSYSNNENLASEMELAALGSFLQDLAKDSVQVDGVVIPRYDYPPVAAGDGSVSGHHHQQYPASPPNVVAQNAGQYDVTKMADAARMGGYGFPQHVSGYDHGDGYGHMMSGYGHMPHHGSGYQQSQPVYKPSHDHGEYGHVDPYHGGYEEKKPKKVYVPIVIKKKKKKKRKTIAVYKGFYVEGGTQIFGKFKKIEDCKKACEITPNCFAADYNPWLKKCYVHTNITACEEMRTHPKLIHFKKIPCDLVETPRGLITLGTQIFGGLEQKGVKSLQDCIKKCATAGSGIAANHIPENVARQICFGIDYDFGTHKCYFHTDETLCPPLVPTIPTPVQLVQAPSVINILLCPISSVTV